MEQKWIRALMGAVILAVAISAPVDAQERITATQSGTPISLARAAALSCHDLDYPVLRCFATSDAMIKDVEGRLRGGGVTASTLGLLDTGYVVVYEHASYGGSSLLLSADQAWLTDIGWNDRISSFKSFGGVGNFRENSPGSGFSYAFGAASQVPSLSGTYNDKFSAFVLN